MPETWIGPNRRALALGFVVPIALMAIGLTAGWLGYRTGNVWYAAPGVALGILGLLICLLLVRVLRQPRVAREANELLLYLGVTEPVRIPIGIVECFFPGQTGGMILNAKGGEAEVRTVIVRLAESANEWHHRDVKPAFGQWCEGYITIRGTWCEPITPALMVRLNRRLTEVQRENKARVETPA